MRKRSIAFIGLVGLLAPALVFGQSRDIENFLGGRILDIINALIRVFVALATLVFIYGVIKYIAAGGDPNETKKARSFIIWSIIGLALIVGIWGVSNFLLRGLFGNIDNTPRIPTIL